MDLASVVAALASVGVRVSGSTPNNNIQGDSSRACPTGLAGPEPSGTLNDPGQHFHPDSTYMISMYIYWQYIFCVHAKIRLSERRSTFHQSTCMRVKGPKLL